MRPSVMNCTPVLSALISYATLPTPMAPSSLLDSSRGLWLQSTGKTFSIEPLGSTHFLSSNTNVRLPSTSSLTTLYLYRILESPVPSLVCSQPSLSLSGIAYVFSHLSICCSLWNINSWAIGLWAVHCCVCARWCSQNVCGMNGWLTEVDSLPREGNMGYSVLPFKFFKTLT